MPIAPPSPLGSTLAAAVARVRREVGDPTAPVLLITPSAANGVLARQQLALASPGGFVRVEHTTPEGLVRQLGRRALAARGLRPQPSGWLEHAVGALVRDLAQAGRLGRYGDTLVRPGWSAALARAVDTLDAAGVDAPALEALDLPEHAARIELLAELLQGVRRRRALDRLYAVADLCDAASPADARWAAAVVLGDRLLAPRVHDVLRAWLAARPHVEVRQAPWHHLEPAPLGLRAAVTGAVLDVPVDRTTRLGAVAAGLFAPGAAAAPDDPTLTLARTPDEVREVGEAVRVVLDAIRSGVPLDRVAVVVPDPAQVDVLRGHLEGAGVPATWLTGPPLRSTPAARFLIHALEIAAGDDTVPAWYDLLRQPGLRLRAALDGAVEGRGRWRRILARCGAVRHTPTILAAVEAWAADLDGEGDRDADRASAANLCRALGALEAAFAGLRAPATLGAHARRWSALLARWWVPSPDRAQLHSALAAWGPTGLGAPVGLDEALAALRGALEGAAVVEGTLNDPGVRVVTPMTLLGGAFDVVVVTGLSEGRLPRRPDEDPILPDALLRALTDALGTRLLDSRAAGAFEARRFAAVVGACTGRLWLSAPATELIEERPLLPSSFLLDVASVLLGRRARYGDLARLQVHCNSRSKPWPHAPDRAVDPLEHRVAAAAADPGAGQQRLARHPTARRLLGLHRALDHDAPTPWTGLLPPHVIAIPGLDGAPLHPGTLAWLLRDPGGFLVGAVLGVRSPPRLQGSADPLARWHRDGWLLDALRRAVEAGEPHAEAVLEAWDHAVAAWRAHKADVRDEDLALARALTAQRLDRVLGGFVPGGRQAPVEGRPVDDLPWTIAGAVGWMDDHLLADLRAVGPARGQLCRDAAELVLVGMVAPGVTEVRAVGLDGRDQRGHVEVLGAAMTDLLREATVRAQAGHWPWSGAHALRLAGEEDA